MECVFLGLFQDGRLPVTGRVLTMGVLVYGALLYPPAARGVALLSHELLKFA